MFQRMLLPLDGSKRAERAIPIAARIARASWNLHDRTISAHTGGT